MPVEPEQPVPDFAAGLDRMRNALWSYSALATALECGIVDELERRPRPSDLAAACSLDPARVEEIVGVLASIGAVQTAGDGRLEATPAFATYLSPSVRSVLGAEVRSDHLQLARVAELARSGSDHSGWRQEQPEALIAQGETGGLFGLVAEAVLPSLDDLEPRLTEPDAEFLDVGAGVGVIATELCRLYPELRATGLEPGAMAREIGRARIAAAGLADRIDLRDQQLEQLSESSRYDLAFLPRPFLSDQAFATGLPRVIEALRPGGWLLVLTLHLPADDPATAAARRFRGGVWGGGAPDPELLADQLAAAGFTELRTGAPIGTFRCVYGRRAPLPASHRLRRAPTSI